MKEITRIMTKDFKIMKLGYDFAGYKVHRKESLSFHHLIIPKRDCRALNIPSEGYVYYNGAILVQETSHDYIHTIERVDREIFERISEQMIEENINGRIDIDNLRKIRDLMLYFEKEHRNEKTKGGKQLIKKQYIFDRIDL